MLNEAVIFNCIACGKPLGTEKMVNTMLAQARRALDVRGAGRAQSPQDVRRLPRDRPHEEREERGHPRCLSVPTRRLQPRRRPSPPRRRRAPASTRLLARLYAGAPDAALLAAIAAAAPLVGEGAPAATEGTALDLAAAWDGCSPPASAIGRPRDRRPGVRRALRRRRQERGQPARQPLADRVHDGTAAGRAARHACPARPRAPSRGAAGRGPPVGGLRDDADPGRRTGGSSAGAACRAAIVLRPPSRPLGLLRAALQYAIVRLRIITAALHNSPIASWRSNVTRSPWNDH